MKIAGETIDGHDFDAVASRLKTVGSPFAYGPASAVSPSNARSIAGHAFASASTEEAWVVEQGQVGFSANAPMATENVGECVGLILRDPVSRKTALAHVDRHTTAESLQEVFVGMPADRPLQAIVWGAIDGENPDVGDADISRENLRKVTAALAGRDVDIIAADIYCRKSGHKPPDTPSVVAIDPKTFSVRSEYPDRPDNRQTRALRHNPDGDAAYAKFMLNYAGEGHTRDMVPLERSFDLTQSGERNPVPLRARDVALINDYGRETDASPAGGAAWVARQYHEGLTGFMADKMPIYREAYEAALVPLQAQIDGAAARQPGNDFSARASAWIRQQPIAVGVNAAQGNQALSAVIADANFEPLADARAAPIAAKTPTSRMETLSL